MYSAVISVIETVNCLLSNMKQNEYIFDFKLSWIEFSKKKKKKLLVLIENQKKDLLD